MAEHDAKLIWEYVDPKSIADDLKYESHWLQFTDEEALAAALAVSGLRVPVIMNTVRDEIAKRSNVNDKLLDSIEDAHIIDLEDVVEDDEYWWRRYEDYTSAILKSGEFVNFDDFMNAYTQTRTSREYITNVFHTLVLFFLEHDPEKRASVADELRYKQSNLSWSNKFSPTRRFFLRTESLVPYAAEKVPAEDKIKGIARVGRRVMRVVLFDNEDINVIWLHERSRFDRQ